MQLRFPFLWALTAHFLTNYGWCAEFSPEFIPMDFKPYFSGQIVPKSPEPHKFVLYENSPSIVHMESERLIYTLPATDPNKSIFNLINHPNVNIFFFSEGPASISEVEQVIHERLCCNQSAISSIEKFTDKTTNRTTMEIALSSLMWRVCKKADGAFVGMLFADYNLMSLPNAGDAAPFYKNDAEMNIYVNLAYAVDPIHQRQGYATEMSLAFIQTLFSSTSTDVVVHNANPSNIGSTKAAITCGFMEKGIINFYNAEHEIFRILRKETLSREEQRTQHPTIGTTLLADNPIVPTLPKAKLAYQT